MFGRSDGLAAAMSSLWKVGPEGQSTLTAAAGRSIEWMRQEGCLFSLRAYGF
jgi:hypothetical protein